MFGTFPSDRSTASPHPHSLLDHQQSTEGGPHAPLSSFVGRQQDLDTLIDLVSRPDVRLLTITGAGGIGKTRVALRVADVARAAFSDGVTFVSLASLRDPGLVLPAVAQALGVPNTPRQPLPDRLQAYLAEREVLLVLDNLEHLVKAAPVLAELVASTSHLTVLCTSRTHLHVSGEQVVPLAPLPLAEARQLFAARAQAQLPTFSLTGNVRPVVDTICERLDRLPLAIELAAARVPVLPPRALLAQLEHRLDVLTGGPRDVPARLRTMRDAIGWSGGLLTDEEQALFRQLGVFVGGFTLEAAQTVAGAGAEEALDGISTLVAASLVIPMECVGDEPRFSTLETVREFAAEQLAHRPDEQEVRARHARYYLALAEQSDRCWFMPIDAGEARLRQLTIEVANFREAMAWFREQGDVPSLLRMASLLGGLWVVSGHAAEGERWLEAGLADAAAVPDRIRAKALATLCWALTSRSELERALSIGQQALAIVPDNEWDQDLATAYVVTAVAAYRLGHYEQARQGLETGLKILQSLDQSDLVRNQVTTLSGQLGFLALVRGDIAESERWLQAARTQEGEREHSTGGSFLYAHFVPVVLGDLARAKGDPVAALHHYQQALVLGSRHGNVRALAHGLGGLAGSLAVMGEHMTAARLFGGCERLHETAGFHFRQEMFDRQRAFGLPEPWLRAHESFGEWQKLRDTIDRPPLPPIPDTDAVAAQWEAGRSVSIEDTIAEGVAVAVESLSVATEDVHPFGLTPRELEVLQLLAEGRSNRVIAETLSISERTVENHVLHILTKLDLGSRTAAATWAVRHGLA